MEILSKRINSVQIKKQKGEILITTHDIYRFSQRENRLTAHVKSGKGNVPVVCISSGKTMPPEIEIARADLRQQGFSQTLIRWIGWQQIYTELNDLDQETREKPEIEGLRKSLEMENISTPIFKGFKKGELTEISDFVKSYPSVFQNAKQLIEDVIEYVQGKDENADILYSRKQTTTFPLMKQVSAGFRYLEMGNYHASLGFDFSQSYVHQKWELSAKQVKALSKSQLSSVLADLSKENFKFERYNKGNLEEIADMGILQQLPDELGVVFSRYYLFSDNILCINPEDLVKFLGDGMLWMLNFFKTAGLYAEKKAEA